MTDKGGVKLSALPGNVYLLTLAGNGEHRFNQASLAPINLAPDEVEKDPNAAELVTTNEGKFHSNGLDLALFMKDPTEFELTVEALHKLLKRLLLFPMPALAALCGHAAAGGCMLALAHDYRFMSADRGFIFLSEGNCIKGVNSPSYLVDEMALMCSHRFTAKSAMEHGFVDGALPNAASILEEALKNAKALAARKFDRATYRALKMEMFKKQVKELDESVSGSALTIDFLSKLKPGEGHVVLQGLREEAGKQDGLAWTHGTEERSIEISALSQI